DESASGKQFAASLLSGVAYGVPIGSTATLIGQPPMALMKGYLLESHGFDMAFGTWMLIGVPWAIVMLGIAWVVLTKLVYRPEINELPGGKELIRQEHAKLGRMTTAERRVGWIFAGAIFFWIFVPFIAQIGWFVDNLPFLGRINDAQVAMAAAIACFLAPAKRARDARSGGPLLRWSAAKEIPWRLLLLFGGG